MIVTDTGVYVTKTGDIAYVTSWDGYRRAYGYLKNSPELEMSWYSADGSVRHGHACGPKYDNSLLQRLNEPLPEGAKEYGERMQKESRQRHYENISKIVASWPEWKRNVYS